MKGHFSKLDQIGFIAAEDDNLLSECFIDTGYVDYIRDMSDSKIILLGRTGSGKSAIIKYLAETEERALIVNPESLSLSYITNTTIIKDLIEQGVNFELFFKLLWRHVISVEIIRYHLSLQQEKDNQKWFQIFTASSKAKKSVKALEYLEKWGSDFWEETDYRVREITEKFVTELSAKIGYDRLGVGGKLSSDDEIKTEVTKKAQNYINSIQLTELNNVLDAINDLLDDDQKKYYVFIDKLDEDWVEDNLRYKLIKSLIETAKDFKKVKNMKILLALREDLLNRVFEKTRTSGFQKEKYESLCFHINWNYEQLIQVVNKRMKNKYIPNKQKGNTLRAYLPKKIKDEDPLNYILDRTLMRPRDLISYINILIKRADSKTLFSAQMIRDSEGEYSLSRLNALSDEWYTDAPNFINSIKLIRKKPDYFDPQEISDSECEEFCLNLLITEAPNNFKIGRIYKISQQCVEGKISIEDFRNQYLIILYEIGLIGMRLHKNEKTVFFIDEHRDIKSIEIEKFTRIQVHKAFWRALNIRIHDQ